jgi:uncharacterized membrane protein
MIVMDNAANGPELSPPAAPRRLDPVVRAVSIADVVESLAVGLRDFRATPLMGLFFAGIYVAGGNLMIWFVAQAGLPYLVYPLAAGFVLIAPFVATGLYEISRRREAGQPVAFSDVLTVMFRQSGRELGWMAFVTLFIFLMWMYQIRLLLALFLGFKSFSSIPEFLDVVLTTREGLLFLGIGHVAGAILSAVLFSLTVVSFPLLLDRDVDFITAMITSLRAVAASPIVMLGWAAIIVGLTALAMLPYFLGLLLVMPVLGHTTWHLYRRAVAPI